MLKGLGSAGRQAGHVVLDFDETTFEPVFADALELGVPGLAEARALLAVASPLLGGDGFAGTSEFEKPSNTVFQPHEYRSTNCCVPCDYYICIDCVIGGYVASWSLCYCQTPGLMIYYDPYPYWNNPTGPDTIDQIIAEYEDLGRYPIPSRGDFVSEHSSEHFSKYELNSGDYNYFIPGVMTDLAEAVRAKYNERIDSDSETDYGIVISSGYRNPKKNDTLENAVPGSKHQWGRAVDLIRVRSNLPPNTTYEEAVGEIYLAAGAAYPNRSTHYISSSSTYVHVGER